MRFEPGHLKVYIVLEALAGSEIFLSFINSVLSEKMKLLASFLVLFICVLIALAEDTPAGTSEKVCEAGKEFTKDCSTCKCNAEGTQYTCEQRDCPEGQKATQPTAVTEETCKPGELFKNKCNECKCPESGLKSQATCTIIGCPDD